MAFGSQSNGKAHFRFESEYDFESFLDESSNFYDLFVRECRVMINARAQTFLKEFRNLFSIENGNLMYGGDIFEHLVPIGLFHMDCIDADI